MGITLTTAAQNAAANAVVDALDAGAGAAIIEYQTAADAVVAALTMSDPAFGAAAAGVATANAVTDDTDATGGVVTKAVFKDSDGSEVFRMTVSASGGGGDIIVDNTTIGAGTTVKLTSLTYTQPAS